jgi:hypothetical protein
LHGNSLTQLTFSELSLGVNRKSEINDKFLASQSSLPITIKGWGWVFVAPTAPVVNKVYPPACSSPRNAASPSFRRRRSPLIRFLLFINGAAGTVSVP